MSKFSHDSDDDATDDDDAEDDARAMIIPRRFLYCGSVSFDTRII